QSIPFPAIDLILCRNVLSSFTSDIQQLMLDRWTFSLFPGGYLLLDRTEGVHPPAASYQAIASGWNLYRCTSKVMAAELFPGVAPALPTSRHTRRASGRPGRTVEQRPDTQQEPRPAFDFGHLRRFNELLFRSLPIGIVVIDHAYHILTANGIARRLLRLRTTVEDQDFLHAVPGLPYTQVRTAIDTAFQECSMTTLPEVELDVIGGGSG